MRGLVLVALQLSWLAAPAVAQSSSTVTSVESAPTAGASCGTTATAARSVIVRGPGSGSGSVYACADDDRDGIYRWVKRVDATMSVRYFDLDMTGDGTADLRIIGDYDGDGTLELTDVESGIEAGLDSGIRVFQISAGTFSGGFRTSIVIDEDNVVVTGAGIDATTLAITAPCGGTSAALDDGDATADSYFLVDVDADDVTLRDFTIDGGSERSIFYISGECDWSTGSGSGWTCADVDSDGTSEWCPRDWHYPIHAINDNDLTIRDVRILRADRAAIRLANADTDIDSTCDAGEQGTNATIERVQLDGSGEHSLALHWSGSRVSESRFENCGSSSCILLISDMCPVNDVAVVGNTFEEYGTKGISLEPPGFAHTGAGNWTISSNVFKNTRTDTTTAIGLVASSNLTVNKGVSIVGNAINVTNSTASTSGILIQGGASNRFVGVSVIGNTVTSVPAASTGSKSNISINYADGVTLNGNYMDVTGDASTNSEYGIALAYVTTMAASGNTCLLRGENTRCINAAVITDSTITGTLCNGVSASANKALYCVDVNGASNRVSVGDTTCYMLDQACVGIRDTSTDVTANATSAYGDGAGVWVGGSSVVRPVITNTKLYASSSGETVILPGSYTGAIEMDNLCVDCSGDGIDADTLTGSRGCVLIVDETSDATLDDPSKYVCTDKTVLLLRSDRLANDSGTLGLDLDADATNEACVIDLGMDEDCDGVPDCTSVISARGNPDEAGTIYFSFAGTTANATETVVDDYISPALAVNVRALACVVDAAPTAGKSWAMTVRDDAANSTLTCSIADAATTCTDTTHAPTIAAGSKLALAVVGASTPATAGEIICSLCVGR